MGSRAVAPPGSPSSSRSPRMATLRQPMYWRRSSAATATIRRYTEHEAALAACGILETDGVAVVAGTGSSAVAVRDGRRRVAGGWGALLGDQGSAYDIAMWAIRAAIRSSEETGPVDPAPRGACHRALRGEHAVGPRASLLHRWGDAGRDRRSLPRHRGRCGRRSSHRRPVRLRRGGSRLARGGCRPRSLRRDRTRRSSPCRGASGAPATSSDSRSRPPCGAPIQTLA